MSPACIWSNGMVCSSRPTIGVSAPRCTGTASACARVSPCRVNRLADASSPSFTIAENALRTSVSCISLAMPSSLLRSTSSVIGSMSMLSSLEQQIAVFHHHSMPARLDQRSGIVLFHDGGPGEAHPGWHGGAKVDRRLNRGTIPRHPDAARRLERIGPQRIVVAFIQSIAAAGAMHRTQVDDRGRLFRCVTVNTIMQHQEIAIQPCKWIRFVHRKLHFEMVGLADIPDVGGILDCHRQFAEALLGHQL